MSSLPLIVNILYFSGLFQFSLITLVSFKPGVIAWLRGCSRPLFLFYHVSASFMSDLPLHYAFLQLFIVYITRLCGGLEDSWMKWALVFVQLPTVLFEFILFYRIFVDKKRLEQSLYSTDLRILITNKFRWFWLKHVLNPVWEPKQIKKHKDISYVTEREMQEAYEHGGDKDLKRLTLDVITSNIPSGGLKPVLIHFPGGSWTSGAKGKFYPYQKLLVQELDWVIVNANYRLAPSNPYPTHLLDCKRVIRWVKQNIEKYGGDSKHIVIAGDSAGGHLAGMIAFTPNQPRYQPGFEDIDTSVQGFISFNGVLDLELDPHRTKFFSEVVCQQPTIDHDFMFHHSPTHLVNTTPTLILSGSKDGIVNSNQSENYKKESDEEGGECLLVLLPYAHHYSHLFWSPRSAYTARLVLAWCKRISNDMIRRQRLVN